MQLKIQQLGNSLAVTIPKEELVKRGKGLGDMIEIEFLDDPFWDEIKRFSKEDRKRTDKQDNLSADDMSEWSDL
jgi:antitoxin component of MazEF toxin-antitoxin module